MATKFFCDRCNFFTDDNHLIAPVNIPIWNQYTNHNLEKLPNKSYDLCERCIKALGEFMKPLPTQG
jgi:hypothetical protein